MAKRNDFRKRYLVTEGDLFQLYANIMEVRNEEKRAQFMSEFRKLQGQTRNGTIGGAYGKV